LTNCTNSWKGYALSHLIRKRRQDHEIEQSVIHILWWHRPVCKGNIRRPENPVAKPSAVCTNQPADTILGKSADEPELGLTGLFLIFESMDMTISEAMATGIFASGEFRSIS
jgi:hypothetical protein